MRVEAGIRAKHIAFHNARRREALFTADPKARADLTPGALYAIAGESGWIYYGQVTPAKSIGFFHRRDRAVAEARDVLRSPMMSKVCVGYPSIGRALRIGEWKKLGRFDVHSDLLKPCMQVQWPVGTLIVTVWADDGTNYTTRVEDPRIQNMERMAVWDAVHHIPGRLVADFGIEEAAWHVGGPIWRERRIKEEFARRFDQPWHRLPSDWVPTCPR